MQTLSHSLRSKLFYLISGIICALLVITGRLIHLQIHLMDSFFTQSQKNFLRVEKIPSSRGNIIDRDNVLLVTNRPVINLYWHGTGKKKFSQTDKELLQQVACIVGSPLDRDPELLNDIKQTERLHSKLLLARDLSFDQLSKIEELFPNNPTLKISTNAERFYPYKSCASHILGYLSCLDTQATGSMGLEKLFEEALKGEPGARLRTINSIGRNLREVEQKKALSGTTLKTTLDIGIQQIIEKVFPSDHSGTFIILDPEDGSILALVSRPNFDPSTFLRPISSTDWHEMQERKPFLNRAFNASYPPGSLFKLVSMSAMLEHDFITPESIIDCRGRSSFYNRDYYCAHRAGHGKLSAMEALAESCNIPFFEVGKKIDINLLAEYANIFGLGKKTNIIFNEQTGLIPNKQWKIKVKKERWWQGETLSAIIGQSFLLTTPIQMACMISSIFTGFLPTPRILMHQEVIQTPLAIKPSTLAFLRKSMKSAVTHGTGRRVNRVKNIEIYAKTSTAQTSRFEKRDMGSTYKEHAWFAGYFNYKDNKPLTFVILVENIGSSREATEVAKNFLIEYKHLMDERLNNEGDEDDTLMDDITFFHPEPSASYQKFSTFEEQEITRFDDY